MKVNKKLLNWSAWITLLIAYVLPYKSQSTDGFATYFGYPISFLTVYKTSINTSLFMTERINLFTLAINILILYFLINFVNTQLVKIKFNRNMKNTKDSK